MPQHAPPAIQPARGLAKLNLLAYLLMIGTNALSIALPLNGKTQQQLSAQYPNLFTPAGFTFSVWGVIYFFLGGFAIYQAMILWRRQSRAGEKIAAISPLFIGTCLCNAAWLVAWHYEQIMLSVAIMVVYLVLLISIHQRLRLAWPWQPLAPKLWLDVPFSLSLGWISIATIANITAWCVQNNWGYHIMRPATWAMVLIITGMLLALLYIVRGNNLIYGLVVLWALYGIGSKLQNTGSPSVQPVINTVWIAMGLIFATLMVQAIRWPKKKGDHPLFSQP